MRVVGGDGADARAIADVSCELMLSVVKAVRLLECSFGDTASVGKAQAASSSRLDSMMKERTGHPPLPRYCHVKARPRRVPLRGVTEAKR